MAHHIYSHTHHAACDVKAAVKWANNIVQVWQHLLLSLH